MKIKIGELKKSLAQCHVDSGDDKLKFLLDVQDPSYFLNRTMETIHECQSGVDVDDNARLAIQLMNMFRVYHQKKQLEENLFEDRHGSLQGQG